MQCWGIEWPEGFRCNSYARYGSYFERVLVEWDVHQYEGTFVVAKIRKKEWPRYDAKFIVTLRRVLEGGIDANRTIAKVRTPEEALAACLFYDGRNR